MTDSISNGQSLEVDGNDLWTLLLCTVRYSLGRQTYMTSLSWELVVKHADALTTQQLLQVAQEIRQAVNSYWCADRMFPDRDQWLRGAIKIERIADGR